MKKAYVVTSGSYSDYGIDAVFSTRELADEYLIRHRRHSVWIEEYDLDVLPNVANLVRGPQYIAKISLTCGSLYLEEQSDTNWYRDPHKCELYREWTLLMVTSPISHDHATKVAVEKRQEFLRTGQIEGVKFSDKEIFEIRSIGE